METCVTMQQKEKIYTSCNLTINCLEDVKSKFENVTLQNGRNRKISHSFMAVILKLWEAGTWESAKSLSGVPKTILTLTLHYLLLFLLFYYFYLCLLFHIKIKTFEYADNILKSWKLEGSEKHFLFNQGLHKSKNSYSKVIGVFEILSWQR